MTKLEKMFDLACCDYPETMLIFKIGDFWEAFGNEAEELHRMTGCPVSRLGPMLSCAFPWHELDMQMKKFDRACMAIDAAGVSKYLGMVQA
jgi:DNA mismatch repair ATPase MutS